MSFDVLSNSQAEMVPQAGQVSLVSQVHLASLVLLGHPVASDLQAQLVKLVSLAFLAQ